MRLHRVRLESSLSIRSESIPRRYHCLLVVPTYPGVFDQIKVDNLTWYHKAAGGVAEAPMDSREATPAEDTYSQDNGL